MKKNIKLILSYALFLFLLVYIFKYANLDLNKLTLMSLRDFFILSLLSVFFLLLNSAALKFSIEAFKGKIDFSNAFYISQYYGGLFNYLPFKAGIVAEAAYLKIKYNFPINKFITATILVYLANFFIYFLVGIPLIIFFDFSRVFKIINPVYLFVFLLLLLVAILIYAFLPEAIKDKHEYLKYLNYLFQNRKDLFESSRYVFYLLIVSAIVLLIAAWRFDIIFNILNYQIPFPITLMLAILAGFSFIVALTPGNLVVREAFLGGLTYIMLGNADIGVVASVIMRIFDLFWLLIFGAYSFFKLKPALIQNKND